MIVSFFHQYATVLYRLTLFAILSRELYHAIKNYGLPLFQEMVLKEANAQDLLVKTRNNLRSARLRAEKALMTQSAVITLAEEAINKWYAKIIPELQAQQIAQKRFLENLKIIRATRRTNFQILTIQKELTKTAISQTLLELPHEISNNGTETIAGLINNFAQNQVE